MQKPGLPQVKWGRGPQPDTPTVFLLPFLEVETLRVTEENLKTTDLVQCPHLTDEKAEAHRGYSELAMIM